MRKNIAMRIMLVAAMVGLVGVVMSGSAWAVITGSDHDFSGAGWGTTEICIVCHTPHNADNTVVDAPLWNHEVTAATFDLYTGFDMDAGVMVQPGGSSKLCLSCHDGTVAIDSFGGGPGTPSVYVSGDALIGTDLADDHPISFTYDTQLSTDDGGLYDPATTTAAADRLINGKVECSSCHDAHNTAEISKMLVISNSGSALCLTCHIK